VPEVRLIGKDGEQLGVVAIDKALALAEESEIDLVEIAPTAKPPVCRLMDYGKFKYTEAKKRHEAKLKQKQIQVKEIKFRPGTDEGDYQIKLLERVKGDLEPHGQVEQFPKLEGRQMIMVLSPKKHK
jgi:translation initiation factor IF-3